MVKVLIEENKKLYQCEECGFKYTEKEWAEKCEAWCKEHKSCNLEIIKHAIKEPQ
jgi:lipopolysaccharide biosynthesis regulator YciM